MKGCHERGVPGRQCHKGTPLPAMVKNRAVRILLECIRVWESITDELPVSNIISEMILT